MRILTTFSLITKRDRSPVRSLLTSGLSCKWTQFPRLQGSENLQQAAEEECWLDIRDRLWKHVKWVQDLTNDVRFTDPQ